jgi:peroxiredoxin
MSPRAAVLALLVLSGRPGSASGDGLEAAAPAPQPAPASSPAAAGRRPALEPGTVAPAEVLAAKMTCTDGRQLSVADAKGAKGTLIVFTCNHCPFVKAWQERLVQLGNAAAEKGIGVIAVNSNDVAVVPGDALGAMKGVAEARGYRFPYACDESSRLARAFGATRTPEVFLLDASGRVAYHGAIDDNAENPAAVKSRWLADAIDAVVAGREVPVKKTKAIGCAIKYPVRSM